MEEHPSVLEVGKLPSDFHQGGKLVTYHVILRRKGTGRGSGRKRLFNSSLFLFDSGLEGVPSSQNYLKVHEISDPFPFPPRNVPCNSSGTPTVSQGEKVVEAHSKGGIVPSHRMCPTANCLNSAPSSPLLCLHIDVV